MWSLTRIFIEADPGGLGYTKSPTLVLNTALNHYRAFLMLYRRFQIKPSFFLRY